MSIIFNETDFANKSCIDIFDGLMKKCDYNEDLALSVLDKYKTVNDGYNEELEKAREALELVKNSKKESSLGNFIKTNLQEVNLYAYGQDDKHLKDDLYKLENKFLPILNGQILVNTLSDLESDFIKIDFKKGNTKTGTPNKIIGRPFTKVYDKTVQRKKYVPEDLDKDGNRDTSKDIELTIEEVLELLDEWENSKLAKLLNIDVSEYEDTLEKGKDTRTKLLNKRQSRIFDLYDSPATRRIINKIDDKYKETEEDQELGLKRLIPSLEKRLHDDKFINQLDSEDIDQTYYPYYKKEFKTRPDELILSIIQKLRGGVSESVLTEEMLHKTIGDDKNKINALLQKNGIDPEWLTRIIYLKNPYSKELYRTQITGWDSDTKSVVLSNVDDNPFPTAWKYPTIDNFKKIIDKQSAYDSIRNKEEASFGITNKATKDTDVQEVSKNNIIELITAGYQELKAEIENLLYEKGKELLTDPKTKDMTDDELYDALYAEERKILGDTPLLPLNKYIKKFNEKDPTVDESNLVRKIIKKSLGDNMGYIARKDKSGNMHYYITSNHNVVRALQGSELERQAGSKYGLNNFKTYI